MTDFATLWDWRRAVAALYADIRADEIPSRAHARWSETRSHLFASHPQSPIEDKERARYRGPFSYDYNPTLRFTVSLRPISKAVSEQVEVGPDGAVTLEPFALTHGLASYFDTELTIYWITGYGGGAFLPFGDATNGRETYGGGRYLLDTIKGVDLGTTREGLTILDFNFAYNPSCAYSARYVCPLAPSANRLSLPIRAGERQATSSV